MQLILYDVTSVAAEKCEQAGTTLQDMHALRTACACMHILHCTANRNKNHLVYTTDNVDGGQSAMFETLG
jgi:hypothetical protein